MDKPQFDHYSQSAPEYTEQILWHRIVITVVVALLIVAGSAWVAYKFLKTPEAEIQSVPGLNQVGESSIPADDGPQDASVADVNNGGTLHVSTHTEPSGIAASEAAIESTPDDSAPEPLPQEVQPEPAEEPSAPMMAVATTTAPAEESEPISKADTTPKLSSAGSYQVNTRIQSNDITRAELADEMVDLEPKSALDNTANLTAPFMKLYFYTDLTGRSGDRLTYTWSRNGTVAARVRIGVGSDRWRSHSSKNINENMRGDWEVVVTDKQGQTLASSHFVIPDVDTTHP